MSGDVQTRQRRKDKKKAKREDDSTVPGVDTSKFNESDKKASVQMHVPDTDHDHGAGMCAKIVFFSLMAILLGLVVMIVLENRGSSDVDTPLSESRFSEYLQGWVDEKREEDHHDEVPFQVDDHDEESNHNELHEEAPSVPEDEPYPEEKDISNNDNDDDESQELNAEINVNESEPASQEQDENDDEDENNSQEIEDENKSQQQQQEEEGNIYEDSTPFEEEDDDDEINAAENVVDIDAGEDLLLQKLAEEIEIAQQQKQQEASGDADNDEQGSSSQIPSEEGGAQSYMEELLRQQTLEENY